MTPAAITAEATEGRPDATFQLPTLVVAGKPINTGAAPAHSPSYMRIHTLEATGGLTYSQMGRFTAKPGTPAKFTDGHGGTSDRARTPSSIRRRSSRSTTAPATSGSPRPR